jgi:hypothetical protein
MNGQGEVVVAPWGPGAAIMGPMGSALQRGCALNAKPLAAKGLGGGVGGSTEVRRRRAAGHMPGSPAANPRDAAPVVGARPSALGSYFFGP